MNDIKSVIAKNIAALRQARGMTQIDLAERLNYSDKAVSKWERAESMPDIAVLVEIAALFEVSLDYLVSEEHPAEPTPPPVREHTHDRGFISGISILLVWFVALLAFVVVSILLPEPNAAWLAFVWACPASMIVWLVLNSIWFNRRRNYLIISLLMWSMLAALHVTVLLAGVNIWLIYLLGVPGQCFIVMWSRIKRRP